MKAFIHSRLCLVVALALGGLTCWAFSAPDSPELMATVRAGWVGTTAEPCCSAIDTCNCSQGTGIWAGCDSDVQICCEEDITDPWNGKRCHALTSTMPCNGSSPALPCAGINDAACDSDY